jgi:hypothetical protein
VALTINPPGQAGDNGQPAGAQLGSEPAGLFSPIDGASPGADQSDGQAVPPLDPAPDVQADGRIGYVLQEAGVFVILSAEDPRAVAGCQFDLTTDVYVVSPAGDRIRAAPADALNCFQLPGGCTQGPLG